MILSILVSSSEISTISRHCILVYQYPTDVVSSPTSISETGNQELETRIYEEQLKGMYIGSVWNKDVSRTSNVSLYI